LPDGRGLRIQKGHPVPGTVCPHRILPTLLIPLCIQCICQSAHQERPSCGCLDMEQRCLDLGGPERRTHTGGVWTVSAVLSNVVELFKWETSWIRGRCERTNQAQQGKRFPARQLRWLHRLGTLGCKTPPSQTPQSLFRCNPLQWRFHRPPLTDPPVAVSIQPPPMAVPAPPPPPPPRTPSSTPRIPL